MSVSSKDILVNTKPLATNVRQFLMRIIRNDHNFLRADFPPLVGNTNWRRTCDSRIQRPVEPEMLVKSLFHERL